MIGALRVVPVNSMPMGPMRMTQRELDELVEMACNLPDEAKQALDAIDAGQASPDTLADIIPPELFDAAIRAVS